MSIWLKYKIGENESKPQQNQTLIEWLRRNMSLLRIQIWHSNDSAFESASPKNLIGFVKATSNRAQLLHKFYAVRQIIMEHSISIIKMEKLRCEWCQCVAYHKRTSPWPRVWSCQTLYSCVPLPSTINSVFNTRELDYLLIEFQYQARGMRNFMPHTSRR